MEIQNSTIQALINLHSGLARQGPGDTDFSQGILKQLPALPPNPRIADIGCGAGAGALLLARHYRSRIKAVDFAGTFLLQLMARAEQQGLADLIEPIECDMADLPWQPATIDLIWSEGAAYNMTFEGALKTWRPLLSELGIAVISEMNYFAGDVPTLVKDYTRQLYPGIKTETDNLALINASDYEVLIVRRLPAKAWWDNYYQPLIKNIAEMKGNVDSVMQAVIEETETEMDFFKTHADHYGYTYFIMRAI